MLEKRFDPQRDYYGVLGIPMWVVRMMILAAGLLNGCTCKKRRRRAIKSIHRPGQSDTKLIRLRCAVGCCLAQPGAPGTPPLQLCL